MMFSIYSWTGITATFTFSVLGIRKDMGLDLPKDIVICLIKAFLDCGGLQFWDIDVPAL